MKAEKELMLAGQEKAPSVLLLNDHMELILDGTLYSVSCEFSDSGHLPDLLDTLILENVILYARLSNEWYARDTSKKIKSVFRAKGNSGKHVASTCPYGYLKDEKDGNHWIVDEEAAEVVRRIFRLTIEGYGPYQITQILKNDKVEIPAVHMARFGQGLNKSKTFKDPYNWSSSTVVSILRKPEYLGHTVNFKTAKHFKDKKSHYVSQDNWVIFENTQECCPYINTFEPPQKARKLVISWDYGVAHPS